MIPNSPKNENAPVAEPVAPENKDTVLVKPESPSRTAFGILEKICTQGIADRVASETKKILKTFDQSRSVANAFMEVAAERTRADNIWCGINAVGTHMAEEQFFTHLLALPGLTPDQTVAYSYMRDQSTILKNSRDAVRKLLIADAATDSNLYPDSSRLESGNASGGLDPNRSERHLDDEIISRTTHSINEITTQKQLWLETAQRQESVYQVSVSEKLREPINKEFFAAGGNDMRRSIENIGDIKINSEALISGYQRGDKKQYGPNLLAMVDKATLAQGYLEHMHYYSNLMLLRSFEENGNKLTEEQKLAMSPKKSEA